MKKLISSALFKIADKDLTVENQKKFAYEYAIKTFKNVYEISNVFTDEPILYCFSRNLEELYETLSKRDEITKFLTVTFVEDVKAMLKWTKSLEKISERVKALRDEVMDIHNLKELKASMRPLERTLSVSEVAPEYKVTREGTDLVCDGIRASEDEIMICDYLLENIEFDEFVTPEIEERIKKEFQSCKSMLDQVLLVIRECPELRLEMVKLLQTYGNDKLGLSIRKIPISTIAYPEL